METALGLAGMQAFLPQLLHTTCNACNVSGSTPQLFVGDGQFSLLAAYRKPPRLNWQPCLRSGNFLPGYVCRLPLAKTLSDVRYSFMHLQYGDADAHSAVEQSPCLLVCKCL